MAEWRESCDLIYGFITDRLEFDQGAHVIATELLEALNRWLRARGHDPWSAELFSARFAAHSLAREHNVTKKRVRPGSYGEPSRPSGIPLDDPKGQYSAWLGVRYQIDETAGQTSFVHGVQDSRKVPIYSASRIGVSRGPAHPAQGNLEIDWEAEWRLASRYVE